MDSTRANEESLEIGRPTCSEKQRGQKHWLLVISSIVSLILGQSAGTLLGRFYFQEGGGSRWLQSLLPCVGWPLLLIPVLYNRSRCSRETSNFYSVKFFAACATLGAMSAVDNMLYTWGISFLPVSTFSLLCSTQLAFTAVFACILVGQRMTPYIWNSLVLLTLSAIILGLHSQNDRPQGISNAQFIWGFIFTILASAMFALICPLMQLIFNKVTRIASFATVVETQAYVFMFGSVVSMVGLLASGDLKNIKHEIYDFKAGPFAYYMQLIWYAMAWQICYLGTFGLVFLVSSLFSNVVSTVAIPIVPILAVLIFNDKMDSIKGMAMVLSIWGFVSYVYGELQYVKTSS